MTTHNGRDARGRFGAGNPGGPGNPHARKSAQLRKALLQAVNPKDIRDAISALVDQARKGNITAIKELLDRTVGPASLTADLIERIGELERLYAAALESGAARQPLAREK